MKQILPLALMLVLFTLLLPFGSSVNAQNNTESTEKPILTPEVRYASPYAPADIAVIATTTVDNSVLKMLGELGYSYDLYQGTFPADYSVYKTIIQAMDGGTVTQIPELATFISAGGCAIILGGSHYLPFVQDVSSYLMTVDTTNYVWTLVTGTPDIYLYTNTHLLAQGLPWTYDFVDSQATYYMLRILDPGAYTVAWNGDGYKAIVTKSLGEGKFTWFINSPIDGYWANVDDYGYLKTYLGNAIKWCAGKVVGIDRFAPIRGGVAVVGSTEGFVDLGSGATEEWKLRMTGISTQASEVLRAYLYIPTFLYEASGDSWAVVLTDPSTTLTWIASGSSPPYDEEDFFELFRYDITWILDGLRADGLANGVYTVTVENIGPGSFSVYGAAIVVVFTDDTMPTSGVWINDGLDYIGSGLGTCSTTFQDTGQPADLGWGSGYTSLYTIVGGGQSDLVDDKLYFDGYKLADNPFDSSNGYLFDVDNFDVRGYMGTGDHQASFDGGSDYVFVYSTVLTYVPVSLEAFPAPFIEPWYALPVFIVGGTHQHGPYNWQAWTVDVLGSIGIAATLGQEAENYFAPTQYVDADVATYDPGTGEVTVDWSKFQAPYVVSVGGPAVNIFTLKYEQYGGMPFYMSGLPSNAKIHSAQSGIDYGFVQGPYGYDHALIALHYVTDPGLYVLVVYGVTGKGSQAASFVLQNYAAFSYLLWGRAAIIRWDDTNGDSLVSGSDSFSVQEFWQ